ncbi:hypothetical protein RHDE110596_02570 [Prescottella defluvii]
MLPCNAEGRAWDATGQQVDAGVLVWIPRLWIGNVPDPHYLVPMREVVSQRGCSVKIEFNGKRVLEPGAFESKGLPAGTSANLDHFESLLLH